MCCLYQDITVKDAIQERIYQLEMKINDYKFKKFENELERLSIIERIDILMEELKLPFVDRQKIRGMLLVA